MKSSWRYLWVTKYNKFLINLEELHTSLVNSSGVLLTNRIENFFAGTL